MTTTSDYLDFVRDRRRAPAPSGADPIPYVTFSTDHLPAAGQLDAWRDWFSPLFAITPPAGCNGFKATNDVWRVGGMTLSRVVGPSVRSERTAAHVRRSGIDHWVITLCRTGSTHFNANQRDIDAPQHVPFLWSMGEPSLCLHSQMERLQLILCRDSFHALAPQLDGMRGVAFDSPMGRMLGDYIVALKDRLPLMAERDAPQVIAATSAMIAAAIDPVQRHLEAATSSLNAARRERVRRTVTEHLRSPSLTPAALCRMAGVSRSNLYRLLDDVGGIARYIQSRRLAEAHAILSDPINRKSVASIAQELCFPDASGFSRAFKQEYGYSPSDVAAGAMRGVPAVPSQKS